jgi:hypothetical protein
MRSDPTGFAAWNIQQINFEATTQLGKMVVLGLGTASTERDK